MASDQGLPNAPGRGEASWSLAGGSSSVQGSAGISGTVMDSNGDVIPDARVILTPKGGSGERVLTSGANGEFAFARLSPGTFKLTVTAAGMGTYIDPEIRVSPNEMRFVLGIMLPITVAGSSITVSGDRNELAEEQVHLALDQRVLGILPNFYSSYDWHAPPLGTRQKFELAFRSVTDPVAFAGAGALASFEQMNNSFPGYGRGFQGYAKRYGAAYANDFDSRMIGSAVLPSLFHQDPRYFYMGSGGTRKRTLYALSASVICRGDNGRWQPNYSRVLGNFASGGLSNLYYPATSRGVSLTLLNGLVETAGNAGTNLLREFVLRGLTPKVPNYANGKP